MHSQDIRPFFKTKIRKNFKNKKNKKKIKNTRFDIMIIYTAICFPGALKYRNIPENKLKKFEEFIRNVTSTKMDYINLYDKQTKQFIKRVYL